jgi:hypothetical protein
MMVRNRNHVDPLLAIESTPFDPAIPIIHAVRSISQKVQAAEQLQLDHLLPEMIEKTNPANPIPELRVDQPVDRLIAIAVQRIVTKHHLEIEAAQVEEQAVQRSLLVSETGQQLNELIHLANSILTANAAMGQIVLVLDLRKIDRVQAELEQRIAAVEIDPIDHKSLTHLVDFAAIYHGESEINERGEPRQLLIRTLPGMS